MLKKEVVKGTGGRVILMDSITKVTSEDKGAIIVCASHGGTSSGEFALEVPLKAVIFNDAGVGKDNAGHAAEARGRSSGGGAHQRAHRRFDGHVGKRGAVPRERGWAGRRARARRTGAHSAHAIGVALRRRKEVITLRSTRPGK
jgi:hypothetical protein